MYTNFCLTNVTKHTRTKNNFLVNTELDPLYSEIDGKITVKEKKNTEKSKNIIQKSYMEVTIGMQNNGSKKKMKDRKIQDNPF